MRGGGGWRVDEGGVGGGGGVDVNEELNFVKIQKNNFLGVWEGVRVDVNEELKFL